MYKRTFLIAGACLIIAGALMAAAWTRYADGLTPKATSLPLYIGCIRGLWPSDGEGHWLLDTGSEELIYDPRTCYVVGMNDYDPSTDWIDWWLNE